MRKLKKKSKPHKAKDVAPSFVLETSIQIDKIFNKTVTAQLNQLKANGRLCSTNFVLYEYKLRFIKTAIDYYSSVRINGVSDALYRSSQSFSPRDAKMTLQIVSLLARIDESIKTSDQTIYLDRLEAMIFTLQEYFYADIDASLRGDFAKDEIVRYKIESRDDFEGFIDLYNSREVIPLQEFWKQHATELDVLITALNDKVYDRVRKALEKIQSDKSKADTKMVNKAIGDAVISVDTPQKYTLVSLDKIYASTMPVLGQKALIFDKSIP